MAVLANECACGVPQGAQCACQQLARPADERRACTLWLGSVEEEEDEATILSMLSSLAPKCSHVEVTIRRKRWTSTDGRKQGFALLCFESEAVARNVLMDWKGKRPLRAHRWKESRVAAAHFSSPPENTSMHPCECAGMPALEAQLEPLTETQLRTRLARLGHPSCAKAEAQAQASGGRLAKKALLKRSLSGLYRSGAAPRHLMFFWGTPIPGPLLGGMMAALESLRWPASGRAAGRARRGVQAEQYLVLGRASAEQPEAKTAIAPHHLALWTAAKALLKGMLNTASASLSDRGNGGGGGGSYEATSLVVTKNFTGSPHVDARDVTWQYAASFGNFGPGIGGGRLESGNDPEGGPEPGDIPPRGAYGNGCALQDAGGESRGGPERKEGAAFFCGLRGGELCVESEAPGGAQVAVVDTRNRLAKVDGRFPHWVRGYESGTRYSVIWYRVVGPCNEPERAVYSQL